MHPNTTTLLHTRLRYQGGVYSCMQHCCMGSRASCLASLRAWPRPMQIHPCMRATGSPP